MGAPQQPTQTTQISKVELPPWVDKASQQNYAFAQQVANKPLVQYQGPTVAGVAPATQQAWNLMQNAGSAGAADYSGAEGAYAGVAGQGPSYVTPGMLANTDLSPYMNPYTNAVVDTSLKALDQQRQQAIMGNADKASSSNAFGGSRQGITDAVTNSQSAMAAGQLSAQLRSAGYDQAVQGATGDLNRQFQGALSNQSAEQANTQSRLAAAGGLAGLGDTAQRNLLQQFMGLTTAGGQQQQQQQAVLNANKAKFDEAQGYDTNRLNILLASLGMSPYGKTQTTQTTQTGGDSGSPDWAQAGLGALSIFGSLAKLSDRTMKTDIAKVGMHPTGLPIYSYRYKGDPKTYPKMVGPMAQDVRKKFGPAAAPRIGNKLAIDPVAMAAKIGVNGVGSLGSIAPAPTAAPRNRFAIGPKGTHGALGISVPGARMPTVGDLSNG